ncbi:HalOD1 output domain-containing protein [Halomontanus rarus]|uniref:HalOD1 output domain-containing protein n=1 Tax=Halomontanus rarus TaxID=3034020 RepID=UPI00307BFC61
MSEMSAQDNTVEFSEDSITPITTEWGRDSEDTPVYAVVSAVAEAEGTDPVELPPLYEAIDSEALNDLFTGRAKSTVGKVTFQYAGYDVTVNGNGEVQARSTNEA